MHELLAHLDANARVLDLGCGQGSFVYSDCRAQVVALDLSGRVSVRGRAEQLPLASGAVDLVVANHVFEHVQGPEKVAAEISRVLKPSGILFACVPDGFSFSDGLFRRLGGHREHIQRFTFGGFQQAVECSTNLVLLAARRLYSSFSFLPAGAMARSALNWITRAADAWVHSSLSLYGWAFYFGKPAARLPDLEREEYINVCERCGCGHSLEQLGQPGWFYRCRFCGHGNPYFDPAFSRRVLDGGAQQPEGSTPNPAWKPHVVQGDTEDRPWISPDSLVEASPGSIMTLSGKRLAAEAQADEKWPLELGGVQVLVNGRAVPLSWVSAERIVALLPLDVSRGPAEFAVVAGGKSSLPRYAFLSVTAPVLLDITRGQERILLRAAGLGPVAGHAARTTRRVSVNAGGRPARVISSALVADEPGVYQVEIEAAHARGAPIWLEAGGKRSNALIL